MRGIRSERLRGDLGRIAEVAGFEAAVKIGIAFRGTYLYIHGLDALKRRLRDEEIRRAYEKGATAKDISNRFGLTQRQVRRILGEEPLDSIPDSVLHLLKG
ncbi:MAG: hypothetical protein M0Z59_00215 [Nitrospiraceae bacterium]|nr:hypothetical protein [Nitrospiraceae bacterium]